jgi:hypothetical protein
MVNIHKPKQKPMEDRDSLLIRIKSGTILKILQVQVGDESYNSVINRLCDFYLSRNGKED